MYRGQGRRRIQEIIQRFREKGATSPDKAMTIQELGLPPRFEEAMHRRLGQTGIFVEANGKYYLNEERLKQVQEERARGGRGGGYYEGQPPGWVRYGGLLLLFPVGIIVAVALIVLFYHGGVSYFPGEVIVILLVILVVMFIVRLLFWRSRRKYWQEHRQNRTPQGQ